MTPIPLFTRSELTRAFAFLVPPGQAEVLSARWFTECASTDDMDGEWYMYPFPWSEHTVVPNEVVRPEDLMAWDAPEVVAADARTLRSVTDGNVESVLLTLGDLHLSLIALISADAYERLRRVRGFTHRGAERNRLQMQRAVQAYRAARGWAAA